MSSYDSVPAALRQFSMAALQRLLRSDAAAPANDFIETLGVCMPTRSVAGKGLRGLSLSRCETMPLSQRASGFCAGVC